MVILDDDAEVVISDDDAEMVIVDDDAEVVANADSHLADACEDDDSVIADAVAKADDVEKADDVANVEVASVEMDGVLSAAQAGLVHAVVGADVVQTSRNAVDG